MKTFKFVFLVFALVDFVGVMAEEQQECLESAMTQTAMNICAADGYVEAEAELNQVYTKIQAVYKEDELFISKLKEAQIAWIKLRDADFDMQYPLPDKRLNYGSGFSMCAGINKAQITLQRIEFLKQWLVGTEKGDMCGGTKMTQYYFQEMLKSESKKTQINEESMDCSEVEFYGSFTVAQFDENDVIKDVKYIQPLPDSWGDNANLYSSFFVDYKKAPDKMTFQNNDSSISLKKNADNTFDVSREDFASIVSSHSEAVLYANFEKSRCQHIFRLHSRD